MKDRLVAVDDTVGKRLQSLRTQRVSTQILRLFTSFLLFSLVQIEQHDIGAYHVNLSFAFVHGELLPISNKAKTVCVRNINDRIFVYRINCFYRKHGVNLMRVITTIILHWDLMVGLYIATCIYAVDYVNYAKCASKMIDLLHFFITSKIRLKSCADSPKHYQWNI